MSRKDSMSSQCNNAERGTHVNMKQLVKRRRKLHEIPSKPYAGFNFCRECRGWEGDGRTLNAEVLACPNTGCILWPVRAPKCSYVAIESNLDPYPTSNPLYRNRSDYSAKNARNHRFGDLCAECQGVAPGESRDPIRKCCSPKCWLYPWRTGKLDVSMD